MAYQIIVKKRFANTVNSVLDYLEKEWSHETAVQFLIKIDRRLQLLTKQPYAGAPSKKVKEVRGLLVSKCHRIYYRIENDKVILLNMYDSRRDPKTKPY